MLFKVEIIKLSSSETGISGITKSKGLLYSGGIREVECKQILNLHSLFVLLASRSKETTKILTSKGSPQKTRTGIESYTRIHFCPFCTTWIDTASETWYATNIMNESSDECYLVCEKIEKKKPVRLEINHFFIMLLQLHLCRHLQLSTCTT